MFTIALQVLLSLCVTATQTLLRYYIWGVDGGGWYLVTYDIKDLIWHPSVPVRTDGPLVRGPVCRKVTLPVGRACPSYLQPRHLQSYQTTRMYDWTLPNPEPLRKRFASAWRPPIH